MIQQLNGERHLRRDAIHVQRDLLGREGAGDEMPFLLRDLARERAEAIAAQRGQTNVHVLQFAAGVPVGIPDHGLVPLVHKGMPLQDGDVVPLALFATRDDLEAGHGFAEMHAVVADHQAEIDPHAVVPAFVLRWLHLRILPHAVQAHHDIAAVPQSRAHVHLLALDRRIGELARTRIGEGFRLRPRHKIR